MAAASISKRLLDKFALFAGVKGMQVQYQLVPVQVQVTGYFFLYFSEKRILDSDWSNRVRVSVF